MGRKASVRYWESRGGYCCEIKGRKITLAKGPDDAPLGACYTAALAEFRKLSEGQAVPEATPVYTVSQVWKAFRQHLSDNLSPGTLEHRESYLLPFVDRFGERPAPVIAPHEVSDLVHKMRQPHQIKGRNLTVRWEDSSVRNFWQSLKSMFNWAVKARMVNTNQFSGQETPGRRSRGEDCVLTEEQYQTIMAAERSTDWKEFLICLEQSGCRPAELTNATAAHFVSSKRAIVYTKTVRRGQYSHKTARAGVTRVIYLTGEAFKIIERRAQQYPIGPLFGVKQGRNKPLKKWSKDTLGYHFWRLKKRTGILQFSAMSFRHTLASKLILKGWTAPQVALILGNSAAMVLDHYAHLFRHQREIHLALEDFQQETALGRGEEIFIEGLPGGAGKVNPPM